MVVVMLPRGLRVLARGTSRQVLESLGLVLTLSRLASALNIVSHLYLSLRLHALPWAVPRIITETRFAFALITVSLALLGLVFFKPYLALSCFEFFKPCLVLSFMRTEMPHLVLVLQVEC